MTVVSEFFLNEFNEHVREVLRRELASGRHSYLTFNVFNVRLDPEAGFVTVEDELDPNRREVVDLAEFARLIKEHSLE
jgi:hypothetical protein